MAHFKRLKFCIMLMAVTIALYGCAKPPEAERAAAKVSMEQALAAGADKYAIGDFNNAGKHLENAELLNERKRYQKARAQYQTACEAFKKAAAAAVENYKFLVVKNWTMINALEGRWEKLKKSVKKVKKQKTEDAWVVDEQVFVRSLQEAKDMNTDSVSMSAGKINELQSLLARWEAAFPEDAELAKADATKKLKKQQSPAKLVPSEQELKVVANRDSKRYHLPGMRYYSSVKAYHRVFFDSETEAIKAGYYKASR